MKIATATRTAPIPISTQPHAGKPLLSDVSDVLAATGVTETLAVWWLTVGPLPGDCAVLVSVTVSVLAGSVTVFVSVLVRAAPPEEPVVESVVAAVTVPAEPAAATSQASAPPAASATNDRQCGTSAVGDLTHHTLSLPAARAQRCGHDYRWRVDTIRRA